MNYSTAVFLINNQVRAIRATYEDGPSAKRTVFKTLDPSIMEDDLVIVATDTRHGYTVVKVVEVDVDIDFDDQTPVQWVVGLVDVSDHKDVLAQEAEAIKAIKSAELRQKRENLRDAMFANHVEDLKGLPIASIEQAPETKSAKA